MTLGRRLLIVASILVVALTVLLIEREPAWLWPARVTREDFSLPRLDGTLFSLRKAEQKIVIVNFWASWCEPCRLEFPSLLKLAERFDGNVLLVAISLDDDKEGMKRFVKAFDGRRANLEVVWDPRRAVAQAYETQALPETYVLDEKRRVLRKFAGAIDWAATANIEYMQSLLRRRP